MGDTNRSQCQQNCHSGVLAAVNDWKRDIRPTPGVGLGRVQQRLPGRNDLEVDPSHAPACSSLPEPF
jgi:hypothetical protein